MGFLFRLSNLYFLPLPAMTDQDSSYYRPRSPDFSSFQPSFPQPSFNFNQEQSPFAPYPLTSPLAHRASYDASPFFSPQYQRPYPPFTQPSQQYVPPIPASDFNAEMARRSARLSSQAAASAAAAEAHPSVPVPPTMLAPAPAPVPVPSTTAPVSFAPPISAAPPQPRPNPSGGIDVKTKFPVARIKRIMQADEDVGKVAQVTPIAVCKLLKALSSFIWNKLRH